MSGGVAGVSLVSPGVKALTTLRDGAMVAAGQFSAAGTVSVSRIARLKEFTASDRGCMRRYSNHVVVRGGDTVPDGSPRSQ